MYPDKLYKLAFAFRKAKLWKSLYDSELFAVALPDGEIGYCCVMGAEGEHMALALYVGSKGLDSFRIIQESGGVDVLRLKSYETMLSQDCLQCAFEGKDMLSEEELSGVRSYTAKHRIALRGAKAFPQFLRYYPASYPWSVSEREDVRRLCTALEAALEVGRQIDSADKAGLGFEEGPAYDRCVPLLTRSGDGFEWSLHSLPPKQPAEYPEPVMGDDILLARLRKAGKRGGVWACDVVMMPRPILEDDESVPTFPYMLLTVVYETEQALPTEVVSDYDSGCETLLRALGRQMLDHGVPSQIRVVDERTYALLRKLASALRIRLVLENENYLLDEMEMDFLEYITSRKPDRSEETALLAEMFLSLDDESLLSMPDELWEQFCSLERQGMLSEDVAQRLRALSKRRR